MELFIGADVGTTGTKCVLFDGAGEEISSAYEPYPLRCAPGGIAEQDAEDWYGSLCEAVRSCVAARPGVKVASLALSAQGGSVAPVKSGRAIRPAVTWMDARSAALVSAREREEPFSRVYEKTGWPPLGMTLFYPLWLKEHDAAALKADLFLTTADYLALRLTGRAAIDHTSASMTQVFNVNTLKWDEELLSAAGLRLSQLPEVLSPGDEVGPLTARACADMGLPVGAVLRAGAHDQYCAALGAGTARAGCALLSAGTTWVLLVSDTEPFFDPGRCFKPGRQAVPGLWGAMGSMVTGSICLENAKALLGAKDFAEVDRAAASAPPGANGVTFFPFLSGSYVPGPLPANRGALSGLSLETGAAELYRAVMEGVTFELARMAEYYEKNRGGIDGITLAGGAAKSALWTWLIADITGREVRLSSENAACAGAFALASGREAKAAEAPSVLPDEETASVYRDLFEKYDKNFARVCALNGVSL